MLNRPTRFLFSVLASFEPRTTVRRLFINGNAAAAFPWKEIFSFRKLQDNEKEEEQEEEEEVLSTWPVVLCSGIPTTGGFIRVLYRVPRSKRCNDNRFFFFFFFSLIYNRTYIRASARYKQPINIAWFKYVSRSESPGMKISTQLTLSLFSRWAEQIVEL